MKDGAFCTAIAAIAQGATFTLDTNYTAGTVGERVAEIEEEIEAFDFKSGILLTRDAPSTVLPQNAKKAVVCVYLDSTYSKTVNIYIPLKMLSTK